MKKRAKSFSQSLKKSVEINNIEMKKSVRSIRTDLACYDVFIGGEG